MKFNILVIDDEPNIREGLADALKMDGYDVALAEDGKKGLEYAATHDVDLIITDLRMPVMSGEEVLQLKRIYNDIQGVTKKDQVLLQKEKTETERRFRWVLTVCRGDVETVKDLQMSAVQGEIRAKRKPSVDGSMPCKKTRRRMFLCVNILMLFYISP